MSVCCREPQGVLACCTPVPPLLQQHLTEVHQLVVDALKVPYVANVSQRVGVGLGGRGGTLGK